MPIYEFECQKCKDRVEVFQKMDEKHPVKCKKCGGRLEKLVSASAFQFKGSGWYVTDYAGKGRKAAEKAERADKDTAASDEKKSDKSDKQTKESSPAKKTSEKASKTKLSSGD